MRAILAISALTAGNFLFELIAPDMNLFRAVDRSFFQAGAIAVYVWFWS